MHDPIVFVKYLQSLHLLAKYIASVCSLPLTPHLRKSTNMWWVHSFFQIWTIISHLVLNLLIFLYALGDWLQGWPCTCLKELYFLHPTNFSRVCFPLTYCIYLHKSSRKRKTWKMMPLWLLSLHTQSGLHVLAEIYFMCQGGMSLSEFALVIPEWTLGISDIQSDPSFRVP